MLEIQSEQNGQEVLSSWSLYFSCGDRNEKEQLHKILKEDSLYGEKYRKNLSEAC